jgi:hypothetical protein
MPAAVLVTGLAAVTASEVAPAGRTVVKVGAVGVPRPVAPKAAPETAPTAAGLLFTVMRTPVDGAGGHLPLSPAW